MSFGKIQTKYYYLETMFLNNTKKAKATLFQTDRGERAELYVSLDCLCLSKKLTITEIYTDKI
jgi:hypothetical protein